MVIVGLTHKHVRSVTSYSSVSRRWRTVPVYTVSERKKECTHRGVFATEAEVVKRRRKEAISNRVYRCKGERNTSVSGAN